MERSTFTPKGWHSRGYLPHFDGGEIAQTITFRLADSLPKSVLERWEMELAHLEQKTLETERRLRIEDYLDRGTLTDVVHSWKSFTSNQANQFLGRQGRFWQEDYFDRYIRHAQHYIDAINYIENNPVKAGLCARREDWDFSSARIRLRCALYQCGQDARAPGML